MSKEMRVVYAEELQKLMCQNEKIVTVDADLAKADGTWGLREIYPERTFDVGVAEANMISVAAGLASYGFLPFTGSFTAFATRRCCDQIAISVCYAKMNVKMLGTDPGISAELNGGTHMSFEDIAVLRSLPNIVIFEPVDERQLRLAMPQIAAHEGAVYIRLFRKVTPDVFCEGYKFELFKADVISKGSDISLFASGILVNEAVQAVEILKKEGISAELINVHTIKPIDTAAIVQSVEKTHCAVVAENHSIMGGLYSAVCETLAANYPAPVTFVGINDHFGVVGKLDYLKEKYKLTAQEIVLQAKIAIEKKKGK